jgi:hypothetical protein
MVTEYARAICEEPSRNVPNLLKQLLPRQKKSDRAPLGIGAPAPLQDTGSRAPRGEERRTERADATNAIWLTFNQVSPGPTARQENYKTERIAIRLILAVVVLFCIVSASYKTIAVPWFTMTEEFPYAQEVLRFLSGDFRQRFFDIPGTPFIAVVTAVYAPILAILSMATHQSGSFAERAFEHLDLLYLVMRCVSLLAFAIASWLVFLIGRRFATRDAALVGAVVFAAHPIIALTLFHTRIEPFAVLLVSASTLAWLRGIETGRWSFYAGAGFLAGLAMAARFPLAFATLPIFLLYGLARPSAITGFGKTVDRTLTGALLALAVVGGALAAVHLMGLSGRSSLANAFFLSVPHGGYPRATRAIAYLWVLLGAIAATAMLAALTLPGRRLLLRYLDSPLATIIVFFPIGLVIGVPTLFAGADFFLASIEMFVERNAFVGSNVTPGGWIANVHGIWSVTGLYLFGHGGLIALLDPRPFLNPQRYPPHEAGVLFSVPLVVLFCCGCLAKHADRWLYSSILFGCLVGIVSQFGKLQTPRHIAGWLPWFCIIIAAGAEWLIERGNGRRSMMALFALLLGAILWERSVLIAPEINHLVEKAGLQFKLDRWLRANVGPDELVFHTCCEPITSSVVLSWMKSNAVAVPRKYLKNASVIWFGQQSALHDAVEGYVITSRLSYPGQYVEYYRQMNPAELVDPYNDRRFDHRHEIVGRNIYDIFHFDMDETPRLASGGILVREATYGQSCSGVAVPAGWTNTVTPGNATAILRRQCNQRKACDFTVTAQAFGDPAAFCAKDFTVEWTCGDGRPKHILIPAEALGKTIQLRCSTRPN